MFLIFHNEITLCCLALLLCAGPVHLFRNTLLHAKVFLKWYEYKIMQAHIGENPLLGGHGYRTTEWTPEHIASGTDRFWDDTASQIIATGCLKVPTQPQDDPQEKRKGPAEEITRFLHAGELQSSPKWRRHRGQLSTFLQQLPLCCIEPGDTCRHRSSSPWCLKSPLLQLYQIKATHGWRHRTGEHMSGLTRGHKRACRPLHCIPHLW